LTVGVLGHGVDGEVATPEIVLQSDLGGALEDEARVAGRGLALGARQRVFLVGLWVQEDREVTPDGPIAEPDEVRRGRPHDHPVAVRHRPVEQAIAHRAADLVDLHGEVIGAAPSELVKKSSRAKGGRVPPERRNRSVY